MTAVYAEIIAVGTELTTGAKLDTNSQWLSLELAAAGIPVRFHVTVADELDENVAVLRAAVDRSDIVLISGGLGPTLDDLTRDALARLTGTKLVLHEPSLAVIRGMFARRQREMPERNVVQAMFPEQAEPIPNRRGTAPGIFLEIERPGRRACRIAAMPGVPSEMKVMFHDGVLQRIAPPGTSTTVIRTARVNCFGLGESAAEERLGDLTARGRDPDVGITVHEATITLRIVATAATPAEAAAKIEATKKSIYERMGEYAFGEEDDELEHVVVRLLGRRNETLAIAEGATGGLMANRVTLVGGHDAVFRGALVFSRGGAVNDVLGDRVPGKAWGLVESGEVGDLAERCRRKFGADWALAVGLCSSSGDTEESRSVPIVCIALAGRSGVTAVEINVAGDPAIVKSRVAKSAFDLLRLTISK